MTTNFVHDPLGVRDSLEAGERLYAVWSLKKLEERFGLELARTPFSLKLLAEALLRAVSAGHLAADEVAETLRKLLGGGGKAALPYLPARVLLQDFTGVPVLVDLAAMREAVRELGGDPAKVKPVVPTDVVVDHSILVDHAGSPDAMAFNTELEFKRNRERYMLLRWGESAFENVRVFPPGTGICHQINLEHLATVVQVRERDGVLEAFPDSVCGTDSHTTMINGLGVLGWGVGGLEAESVMLGHPLMMQSPSVVGVKLTGRLRTGVTTTDLVLTVTERLRREGVVDQFVEFCGDGVDALTLAERATLANMAPEYGATCGYFPVDDETLRYLRATGRPEELVELVEKYYKLQGMYRGADEPLPAFDKLIEFDLSSVEPSVAGPSRPQDRVPLRELKASFAAVNAAVQAGREEAEATESTVEVQLDEQTVTIGHGSILLAAITSCTNTSNPSVMIAAGLLAQKAVARGLSVPAYVKTSLSPGSRVVTDYLNAADLMPALEALGFHVTGYGCMTCSGSSGPVDARLAEAVKAHNLTTSSVLSGNRNFEGRIHPSVRANYLASPPLVIAFAIAGTVAVDLENDPVGFDPSGNPVYLRDIWPSEEEVAAVMSATISPELFRERYVRNPVTDEKWQAIPAGASDLFDWEEDSTYIKRPPYFEALQEELSASEAISGGRVLALLDDMITTDHLSPGGAIDPNNPAGRYLTEHGVAPVDFNAYGARRGNHEVMMRGTLANIRLKNHLVPGVEGGVTVHQPSGETLPIYEAAMRHAEEGTPLLILAGKEYGAGSSRDWAAKGPALLGVRVVIAESFERIHRSNLICMGVLPLEFRSGESWRSLGIDGSEIFEIYGLSYLECGQELNIQAQKKNGDMIRFTVRARIDTKSELATYRHGGILPLVVHDLLSAKKGEREVASR